MPVTAAHAKDPVVAGPLGGLALSAVRAASPMMVVRAIRWYRDLARLGLHLPFFMVHDFGLLYAAPKEQLEIGPRPGLDAIVARMPRAADLLTTYRGVLAEISQSEASSRARSMRLNDDLVVVVLARVLGSIVQRANVKPPYSASLPLDPEMVRDIDGQLPQLFASGPRNFELSALDALARSRLHVLTLADALDLDTLRLLGMLGPESSAAGALAHVDLLAAISSPAANDIVNFSLELLPSVLETRRAKATGTHAVHGYAGIGNKGSLDSLVLTELAWDEQEFARRMIENEILYYTREQAPDEARRLHYLLIDASASMRGDRQVFARGLSIALGKRLQLAGEEVWMRFFDSRLYDVQRSRPGQLPAAYILGFKGERGRNPARVFAQLATELALLRARDQRDPVVHLITHAALHVPRQLVQEVRRQAHLFGVFILPSGGELDLEYLDLLEGHAVVDHATLSEKNARAAAATKIVKDAADLSEKVPASLGPKPTRTNDDAIPPSFRVGRASIPPTR
ncbi:hypothetical protein AKJ09_02629 [Labilithrix luteola]|uniref:Uncharacterized protein n=1 Tax=Labilithrix luteola TaxID=1391654 RepID=A0A0K1PQZ8_9BACT|nr:hypothetical protein [Labilithrix luteola]AKU95965.1 hypothetical protein AKJ09_02629 [Labilithrix luteola]